jgi:hypothetical protein
MAKNCLVEAIELEIAGRSDDKLSWQTQQHITYVKLLVHDLCQVKARTGSSVTDPRDVPRGCTTYIWSSHCGQHEKMNDDNEPPSLIWHSGLILSQPTAPASHLLTGPFH